MRKRRRAGCAMAFAWMVSACSPEPRAATEREVVGRYEGVGYGDPVPRPLPIHLALHADHTFVGNLMGGPGAYPVRSGRWNVEGRSETSVCTRVRLAADGIEPISACLSKLPNGSTCLSWSPDAQTECSMRKSARSD